MMFSRLSKNSTLKRILIVSLTNIGDVVLTCPVIDVLRNSFPQAQIDLVIGPKAVSLFADNPNFRIKVFIKQASLKQRFGWFLDLRKQRYDCVIDLRNTMLPILLIPQYATPIIQTVSLRALFSKARQSLQEHKKDVHLNRLRQVYDFDKLAHLSKAIETIKEDERFYEDVLVPQIAGRDFVVIAPGAAASQKRWYPKGFAEIADYISLTHQVVFVGDANDVKIVDEIQANMKFLPVSLVNQINLRQLAFILKKCSWALTHDSGVMHLASYFNVPQVVLWGPTSIEKYGPWSQKHVIVKRNEKCSRCIDPKSEKDHNCMSFIEVPDVIGAIKGLSL